MITSEMRTGSIGAFAADLDPRQLHQVVDRVAGAIALGQHAGDHPADRLGIGLVDERLGQHRQGPDRRLQLVRDVGDEVGATLLDPTPFGDVLDERHAAAVRRVAWR